MFLEYRFFRSEALDARWLIFAVRQGAVLATIDSFCQSVYLSHTVRFHVKKSQATIMRSSLEDSPITLVSSWLTSARNSKGNIGSGVAEWESGTKIVNFYPVSRRISETAQDRKSHMGFRLVHNYRPWMTLNGRYALYCRKDASFKAHCTKMWMKINAYHQWEKRRLMTDPSF